MVDGEYIWKYTHNAYDFSVLGNTPITFPIEWHNSKIPGLCVRASVPNYPRIYGIGGDVQRGRALLPAANRRCLALPSGRAGSVFRIDHDEKFNQTTHLQYQPWKRGPWIGFNWRYDSGLVAGRGAVPQATAQGPRLLLGGSDRAVIVNAISVAFSRRSAISGRVHVQRLPTTPTQPLPTACLASQFRLDARQDTRARDGK